MHFTGIRLNTLAATWIVGIAAITAGLVPAQSVIAQGTMGTVPDPISARDLDHYAKRLRLSDQQRQALETFHEEYREAFRVLRETDIERVINESRAMRGGFGAMNIDRAAAEKGLKDLDAVLNKIKNLDTRLFDQVQVTLTEDQAGSLARVRMLRERTRYQAGLGQMARMFNPASQVDLSDLLLEADLPAAERDRADAALVQYETSLTASARKLHEASTKMALTMLDRLQSLGFSQETMADPERRGDMFREIRNIWAQVNQELQSKAGEIADLNRKTLRSLSGLVADERLHDLKATYYSQAYPELGPANDSTLRALSAALALDELSDEQHAAIGALAQQYRSNLERSVEQMASRIDENRQRQNMFDFESDSRRTFQQQMEEWRDQRTVQRESTRAALRELLVPELAGGIDQRIAQEQPETGGRQTRMIFGAGPGPAAFGGGAIRVEARREDAGPRRDPYAPMPISRIDLDRYANRLDLQEDSRSILRSLHADYAASFRAIEDTQFKAVLEAHDKVWRRGGPGEFTPPEASDIANLYALRRAAIEAVVALDDSFFEDVKVTLGADQEATLRQLRQSRLRDVYNVPGAEGEFFGMARRGPNQGGPGRRGQWLGGFPGRQSQEHTIDLARLVGDLTLAQEIQSKVNGTLSEYELAATNAFKTLLDTSMRAQMESETLIARFAARNDGPRRAPVGDDQDQSSRRAQQQARETLVQLNRSTLEQLKQSLDSTSQETLRRAYNRMAFPSVYADPHAADQHIKTALNLPSVSEQQRSQISNLAVEHAAAYDEICEKLVELQSKGLDFPTAQFEQFDWQTFQNQARARERLEFERDDLNTRTASKLKSILSEDQIQQISGLAKNE